MMNIHRPTTSLPSIQINSHLGSFDSGLSQPRDIPGSCNPNNLPPPLLPLNPEQWDNRGGERHRTQSPLEIWDSGKLERSYLGDREGSRVDWDSRRQNEGLRETRREFEKIQLRERYCYKYIYIFHQVQKLRLFYYVNGYSSL